MPTIGLGVIGAGNMAEALLRGAIAANVVDCNAVIVSDPDFSRRQFFTRELGVTTSEDNSAAAAAPRVLLAVKPQVIGRALEGIAQAVRPDATVISIAAGITTDFIAEKLAGRGRIVRVMPNTPMLVGAGVSALCKGAGATDADLAWAERLFAACGKTVRVDEPMIDVVTAVSGSGPAYFFYLIEAMVAAGVAEGLDADEAAGLAAGSCAGAARLLAETDEPPEGLRARITRPGGATQQAIESLEAAGVKRGLVEAIRAAARRSRDLEQ